MALFLKTLLVFPLIFFSVLGSIVLSSSISFSMEDDFGEKSLRDCASQLDAGLKKKQRVQEPVGYRYALQQRLDHQSSSLDSEFTLQRVSAEETILRSQGANQKEREQAYSFMLDIFKDENESFEIRLRALENMTEDQKKFAWDSIARDEVINQEETGRGRRGPVFRFMQLEEELFNQEEEPDEGSQSLPLSKFKSTFTDIEPQKIILEASWVCQRMDLRLMSDQERGVKNSLLFQLSPHVFGLGTNHLFPASLLGSLFFSILKHIDILVVEHPTAEDTSSLSPSKTFRKDFPQYIQGVIGKTSYLKEEDIVDLSPLSLILSCCQGCEEDPDAEEINQAYEKGIEEVLFEKFRPSERFYLASSDESLLTLESVPNAYIEKLLANFIAFKEPSEEKESSEKLKEEINVEDDDVEEILEYKEADLWKFGKELDEIDLEAPEWVQNFSEILSLVRSQRNHVMLERTCRLQERFPTKNILVLAGINHWVGPNGILNLYRHLTEVGELDLTTVHRHVLRLQPHGEFGSDPYINSLPSLSLEELQMFEKIHGHIPPIVQ